MRWPGRRGVLRLRVGSATVRAEAFHRETVTWAGEASYESLTDLTDAIARLAAEPAERCSRLTATLERPPVQTRTLPDLPHVKHRELTALVAHQAGRFFRKNGHPLVTDAVWVESGKRWVAQAAAVEEPVVEAIVAGARAAGLALDGIAPADLSAPFLLLPTSARESRARAARTLLRRWALGNALVWTLVFGLLIGRLVWERRSVERQLASLERPLASVLAARRELHDGDATLRAIADADRDRNTVLTVLGAVTAVLPDSVVLTSLLWRVDGSGVLTGSARQASQVLTRLERADALVAPRLEGPVVSERTAASARERFTIAFGSERRTP